MTEKVTPYAGCPKDGTPLIGTFEVKYKEWHCMKCGGWFEWLSARPTDVTEETTAMYEDHFARFRAGERGPIMEETNANEESGETVEDRNADSKADL
jgi:hypothetical protein